MKSFVLLFLFLLTALAHDDTGASSAFKAAVSLDDDGAGA